MLWVDRYDASFAKLVSLAAYRDSRRSENQNALRDQFHWLARCVFLNPVSASLGVFGERLGTVWIVPERFVRVWDRLGTVWSVLGAFWFSSAFTSYSVYSWGGFGVEKLTPRIRHVSLNTLLRLFVGWFSVKFTSITFIRGAFFV